MNERECRLCPPWVVRCAHWDGRVVYIGDVRPINGWFEVHGPTRILVEHDDPAVRRHESCIPAAAHTSEELNAEFSRREAELLGREVYA